MSVQLVADYGLPRAELKIAWEDLSLFFFLNLANTLYFLVKPRQLSL